MQHANAAVFRALPEKRASNSQPLSLPRNAAFLLHKLNHPHLFNVYWFFCFVANRHLSYSFVEFFITRAVRILTTQLIFGDVIFTNIVCLNVDKLNEIAITEHADVNKVNSHPLLLYSILRVGYKFINLQTQSKIKLLTLLLWFL